jgi:hypothetical protein
MLTVLTLITHAQDDPHVSYLAAQDPAVTRVRVNFGVVIGQ